MWWKRKRPPEQPWDFVGVVSHRIGWHDGGDTLIGWILESRGDEREATFVAFGVYADVIKEDGSNGNNTKMNILGLEVEVWRCGGPLPAEMGVDRTTPSADIVSLRAVKQATK